MIWVLLFSLIFGKSDSPLINPKYQKHVKKVVLDKDRQGQIIEVSKQFKSEIKSLKSASKGDVKSFGRLNKSWQTESQELEEVFSKALESRKQFQEKGIEARLKITPLIKDDEWEDYLTLVDQVWEKNAKSRKKALAKLNKKIDKSEKVINKKIADSEKKKMAVSYINDFRETLVSIRKEYHEINNYGHETLRNRNATKSDLQEHSDKINDLRRRLHSNFIENRQNIKELTTEEQWNAIGKSINRIF